MAVALNLSKQIIQNLEDNRYENLPGDTFIRGYLKLYCRKVDLPEEEVLVGFDNWRLLNRKKGPLQKTTDSMYMLHDDV